ncbi:MAG: DUF1638 domain-containing protein [Bacteroidales bacterium]|nr:DUF1638 domain-containing protein [Bacteroidales bacterium]
MNLKTNNGNIALISCGILKNEILHLIAVNKWKVNPTFLDSSLHVDFNKLWNTLTKTISKQKVDEGIVCYGTCHPLMNQMLASTKFVRTPVQNCVELVLGRKVFDKELEKGAFFLFEDWAVHWERVAYKALGDNQNMINEVFQSEHNYLLCIKTPCSSDFSDDAEKVSHITGLPLKWISVDLSVLEKYLSDLLCVDE